MSSLSAIGVVLLVVALACSWPILRLYLQANSPFIAHMSDRYILSSANRADFASLHPHIGSRTIGILWYQLKATVGIFLINGEVDPQFNIPGRPMLDPLSGILFFLGIASLLRFIRGPSAALCLLWLFIPFTLGMLLSTGTVDVEMAPASTRVQPAVPALCLIIALGLETALSPLSMVVRVRGWARPLLRRRGAIRAILAGLVALTIGVWEVQRYVAFVRSPSYRDAYYTAAREWATFIGTKGSIPITVVGPNAWPVEFPDLFAPNARICAALWSIPNWSHCPPARVVIFDTDPNDAQRYGKVTGLTVHDGPSDDSTVRFWYVEGRRLPDPASVLARTPTATGSPVGTPHPLLPCDKC